MNNSSEISQKIENNSKNIPENTSENTSPQPLIMRYINKYYKAPEHIKTEEEFTEYLEKKEREYYQFIYNENLKINYGRFNFIEWDGSETVKNKIRHIAKTELYELYNYKVDLDYIMNYFGFKKKSEADNFNNEYDENFILNNTFKKKVIKYKPIIDNSFNYGVNSDTELDNNIIDDSLLYDNDNIINDKDYESDN